MTRASHLAAYAVLFIVFAGRSEAGVIRVDFTSQVDYVVNAPVGGISASLGDLVSGTFFYDTIAQDLVPADPTIGTYSSGSTFLSIAGHSVVGTGPQFQVVFDGIDPSDLFAVTNLLTLSNWQPLLIDGVSVSDTYYLLSFIQPLGGLINDGLPSVFDVGTLDVRELVLVQPNSNSIIQFDHLLSIHATEILTDVSAVPEPSSVAVFGIVGCVFAFSSSHFRRVVKGGSQSEIR